MAFLEPELFEILRGFFSLVPPNTIHFPTHLAPTLVHAFFRDYILLNPQSQKYPPSEQYQKSFWKWAIHHLESLASDEDVEIDARMYEHYLSLLPPSGLALGPARPDTRGKICSQGLPLQSPPSQSYVTHFWQPSSSRHTDPRSTSGMIDLTQFETVTLLESRTTIESGTTGLRTWLASFIISQYLISHPGLVKNKRILELGSGIGFLGIITASLQRLSSSDPELSALWMTDVNENVLIRCRDNIQMACNLSSSHPNVKYRLIDWSAALDREMSLSVEATIKDEIQPELILGADLIFDPTLIPALIALLTLCLRPDRDCPEKTAFIAATIRNPETIAQFLSVAQRGTLVVEELEVKADSITFLENIENPDLRSNVKIFKITM